MQFKSDGSLERALSLNYSGCSSVLEALAKAKSNPDSSASQTPKQDKSEYEVMSACIKELEVASKGFDFSSMDLNTMRDLSHMRISSKEEAILWKEAWIKVLKGQGKHARGKGN